MGYSNKARKREEHGDELERLFADLKQAIESVVRGGGGGVRRSDIKDITVYKTFRANGERWEATQ